MYESDNSCIGDKVQSIAIDSPQKVGAGLDRQLQMLPTPERQKDLRQQLSECLTG